MPIERDLRGKRFFITGATGFLGTALVERILRCVPEAEITVLVRPGRRADAAARLAREVIKNDCFDRLRAELGDRFGDEVANRVKAVAGDVGRDGLGLDDAGPRGAGGRRRRHPLRGHGLVRRAADPGRRDQPAGTVSRGGGRRRGSGRVLTSSRCRPPTWPARTRARPRRSCSARTASPSTCPWEEEVSSARRLRADLQAESRKPERLREFTKKARSEIGAAGEHLIAARAEKVREDWVSDELVQAGTARALSLGWPDAYPFTKALGERALVEQWEGRVPITIVRPSIIESALAEPRPGWIRGFRMAEPIIISYARGLLREFPGVPEGIVDVIPVDLVVAAILAVAARGPEPGRPKVYQVASGVRNPLRYGRLVELSTDFFQRNPLYDDRGQPINVPEWSFPGRGRVQRQLRRADTVMTFAEKLLTALPIRGKQAQLAARIEDRHAMAKRALGYVELYGAYTETDARYRVDHLIELWDACDDDDHRPVRIRPGRHRLGPLRARDPPPLGARAHAGAHQARQVGGGQAARPAAAGHPVAGSAPRRLRPRAHAHVLQRRRHLRLARQPPPVALAAGPVRRRPRAPGAVAARARPARSRRLPAVVLPTLRGCAHRAAPGGLVGALPPPAADPVVPRRVRSRAGAPGARAPHAADHRGAGLHHRAHPAPVRRHRVRGDGDTRRAADRAPDQAAADRRGAGPAARRLRRRRTRCRSRSPSPTPTRPATWPCSRPSASRSP